MMLLRFFLLITLVFVSGCYPIERVYERSDTNKDGKQGFETISKITLDKTSGTGAFVRFFDDPELKLDRSTDEFVYTGKRFKSTSIQKLEKCVIIDDTNWKCTYETLWTLEMAGGELRWLHESKLPYKASYRLAF